MTVSTRSITALLPTRITPRFAVALTALALVSTASIAQAQTITFEGVADPSNPVVNINPANPFTKAGFIFTPTNADSAVFDTSSGNVLFGDNTDFFGFAGGNVITLTRSGGGTFDFSSVLLGLTNISSGNSTDITVVGFLSGGGTVSQTFTGLTTATLANLNFSDLTSASIFSSTDSGIDNVTLNANGTAAIPEPSEYAAMGMAGFALCGLMVRARRRKNAPATA